MRTPVRGTIIGAASFVALMALGATAHAVPGDTDFKCRQTINKEYTKYVQTLTKTTQKCNEAVVKAGNGASAPGGSNSAFCDPSGKIPTAFQKLTDKINAKCDNNGVNVPADIWPPACPNFEGGSCTFPIAHGTDIATCLDCIGREAVAQAMDLYYGSLTNGGTNSDLVKCQTTIGKEASKFLTAKDKILGKCRKAVDKGAGVLPCPVPGDTKAGPAIAKAESKKVSKICKACDTQSLDGVTCTGQTFSPAQIGFGSSCPEVTVPFGGEDCGGPINTLNDLVKCVDCVTEFKVDCADALSRPDQTLYPPECGAASASPVCGDNHQEGSEMCDGTDDAACPGQCRADCTCPTLPGQCPTGGTGEACNPPGGAGGACFTCVVNSGAVSSCIDCTFNPGTAANIACAQAVNAGGCGPVCCP